MYWLGRGGIMDNIKFDVEMSHFINYAMHHNGVPFIQRVTIENNTKNSLDGCFLKIVIDSELCNDYSCEIPQIVTNSYFELHHIKIDLSYEKLYSLTERISTNIHFLLIKDNTVLKEFHTTLDILAYDEWTGSSIMPEILCTFVTPNTPKVVEIIAKASEELRKINNNNSAFTGYQTNNANEVLKQIQAIYITLWKKHLIYNNPPASYETIGQRIRLPQNVLTYNVATCIDLVILFASSLEAVGLHPLILLKKGHAFVGCWLVEETFVDCVNDDVSSLSKRTADGIHDIVLVESTFVTKEGFIPFNQAMQRGNQNLDDNFEYCIDVKRCRGSGIRSIPESVSGYSNFKLEERKNINVEKLTPLSFSPKVNDVEKIEMSRLQIWERKLLDFTLRNTLINLRVTKNIIQLMISDLAVLEDQLASGKEYQILGKPKEFENTLIDRNIFSVEENEIFIESLMKSEFKSRRIRTFIDDDSTLMRLTVLYRKAKLSIEENGTNTLYLALGCLKWYESDTSQKARYAPLILIPVQIVRKSAKIGYVIRERDDEPQFNITLLEKLKQDFGIEIGGLDPLPEDEKGIDITKVFNIIRQVIINQKRWDVIEVAFIGLFSFKQFVMWNDIKNRSDDLQHNKIVSSLINNKLMWKPKEPELESDFDSLYHPSSLALPVSVDSSQLAAVCLANRDESFVLHGPPGTGKSQTITNIIANALYHNKSVLFIAEKSAALTVVQKRLEEIGLGPFCLELHSNKASKNAVLYQLEQTLELGKLKHSEEYSQCADHLYQLRTNLNTMMEAIHKKSRFGMSLYELLIKSEKLNNIKNLYIYENAEIETMDADSLINKSKVIDDYVINAMQVDAKNSKLLPLKFYEYSLSIKDKMILLLNSLNNKMNSIYQNSILKDFLKKSVILNLEDLKLLIAVLKWCQKNHEINDEVFDLGIIHQYQDDINELIQLGIKKKSYEDNLKKQFDFSNMLKIYEKLFNDWKLADLSWFLPKMMKQNEVIKIIKINAKSNDYVNKSNALSILEQFNSYEKTMNQLNSINSTVLDFFAQYITDDDFHQIEKIYNAQIELMKLLGNSIIKDELCILAKSFLTINVTDFKIIDELNCISNDYSKLCEICDWNSNESLFVKIKQMIDIVLNNTSLLREWNLYSKSRDMMNAEKLNILVDQYETKQLDETEIKDVFDKSITLLLIDYIIDHEDVLNSFSGQRISQMILDYEKMTLEFEKLTRQEIVARLSAQIPSMINVATSSQVSILKRAIKSNGRAMSIRKLFDKIPQLLKRLVPCMLMSPMSVAQYIDPKYPEFDLVVFDEASQLPTSEAVGAIARGKNVIVVGDPKQLPPTSFFTSNNVDEDNFESEDLESVLDDCLSLSMPQMYLSWHYRSQHESLISFSNKEFYDNRLLTFPSVNNRISKVSYVHVEDGFYDKGKKRVNLKEAKLIVADIKKRLFDPVLCHQSIGVVTFNAAQQNLIDDLLINEFQNDKEFEDKANSLYEPIFIKNLENVQGDERDVILFSICYGPDKDNKISMNFGPLNKEGGSRRLNVAVSRARIEMIVYATLLPQQIDLSRTRADGVVELKSFLEYAKTGKNRIYQDSKEVSYDELVLLIAKEIEKLGYEVNTFIGSSQFKVDIGIINPLDRNSYLLGILIDGLQYCKSKTSRDRNISQINVLKRLGWNIYQLWVLDWWEHKNEQLNKIGELLKTIQINKANPTYINSPSQITEKQNDYKEVFEFEKDEENDRKLSIYQLSSLEKQFGGADRAAESSSKKVLVQMMNEVIKIEAPISQNQLFRRVMAAWDVTRIGARLQNVLKSAVKSVNSQYKTKEKSSQQKFYWGDIKPNNYTDFRIPKNDYRRSLEDICYKEIANAGIYVLNQQISLTYDDFIREIVKVFGFSKCSKAMKKIMDQIVIKMISNNLVSLDDNIITLIEASNELF